MPEQIFGVAFATAVRGLADDPRSERLVLEYLSEQPVNYLELLRWWVANSPLEPRASKHALDMLMARLAAEQLIEEACRVPSESGVIVPAWITAERGRERLRLSRNA